MDWREFVCLPWEIESREIKERWVITIRAAETAGHIFGVGSCVPTPELKEQHRYVRNFEHYMVDGKIYESRATLLRAIKKIEL